MFLIILDFYLCLILSFYNCFGLGLPCSSKAGDFNNLAQPLEPRQSKIRNPRVRLTVTRVPGGVIYFSNFTSSARKVTDTHRLATEKCARWMILA